MALYGIWGSHTVESCPLNNAESRKVVLSIPPDLESVAKKYKINKILGTYHSALEHTFLWVVDAEDPFMVQKFCVDAGVASFNSAKIVPLITFKDVVDWCKHIG
ncbi:MAG: peroxiredoxin [Candidatus Nitrosomirales archaeon]|jgi:peroxiredoxin